MPRLIKNNGKKSYQITIIITPAKKIKIKVTYRVMYKDDNDVYHVAMSASYFWECVHHSLRSVTTCSTMTAGGAAAGAGGGGARPQEVTAKAVDSLLPEMLEENTPPLQYSTFREAILKKKTVKKGTLSPFGDPPPLNRSKGDICCLITDKSA